MSANSHKEFVKRLDNSRYSTFLVAQYLHKKNWDVNIPAFIYPEPHEHWEDNVDDGDIYISRNGGTKYRIDVKHNTAEFSGKHDFPFPFMFVADIRAIKRANPFPLAYVILSKQANCIGIIWGKTKQFWEPHTVFATNTMKEITVMRCPVEHVDFRSLNND